MLDFIHLNEPPHSGQYLSEILLSATDDFNTTKGVLTIPSAKAIHVMVAQFDVAAAEDGSPL